jgi:hypothetical protein
MAKKKAGKPATSKKTKHSEATVRKAAAIVGQVVAHFGAGYAVTWEKSRRSVQFPQIFKEPPEFAKFHIRLFESVLKELADPKSDLQNWDTDAPMCDSVCLAAYQHGTLAFDTSLKRPLKYDVIYSTLRVIHDHVCPPGSGGGPVCRF